MSKERLEDVARRAAKVLARTSSCPNCHATGAHLRNCPIRALIVECGEKEWADKIRLRRMRESYATL